MKKDLEILAPGGDIESIKAAIAAGAGAIYCGIGKFNARTSASKISYDELIGVTTLAHQHNCKIFLTLNVVILETELPELTRLLNRLVNTKVDGVIVQDLGLFYILSKRFKSLEVHASTQVNTHNQGQVEFLKRLSVGRVNFARELNIQEIKSLTKFAHSHDIEVEIFVHGSYCIGFSGQCYFSSVHGGNSGNRGRCGQPCRDQYVATPAGAEYPLNLKDNSSFFDLADLVDAGADSLKIEGRIKKSDYVYTIVDSWKKQITSYQDKGELLEDNTPLYTVFNRDFTNGFLKDSISKDMYIDNSRTNVLNHFSKLHGLSSESDIKKLKTKLYNEKTELINTVKDKVKNLEISKKRLRISIEGKLGSSLKVVAKTSEYTYTAETESCLIKADKYKLDEDSVKKLFSSFNSAEFLLEDIDLAELDSGLFVSFKDQTSVKSKIAYFLNDSVELIPPVELPQLEGSTPQRSNTELSVLISSPEDVGLSNCVSANLYYQVPDAPEGEYKNLLSLFNENKKIVPWFPAVLIGESFDSAAKLLEELSPNVIVTNNLGVAMKAYELGLDWIAGPSLNITNSYSLSCLKSEFNCVGAFISNELKRKQIANIRQPSDFKLYYSILHPAHLLTSKQCMFLTTAGCSKSEFDSNCIHNCEKATSITNVKGTSFVIDKKKGSYNSLYSDQHFMNLDIVSELAGHFSELFIDLRDIKTKTSIPSDKAKIIEQFTNLINEIPGAVEELKNSVAPTMNDQYKKGL